MMNIQRYCGTIENFGIKGINSCEPNLGGIKNIWLGSYNWLKYDTLYRSAFINDETSPEEIDLYGTIYDIEMDGEPMPVHLFGDEQAKSEFIKNDRQHLISLLPQIAIRKETSSVEITSERGENGILSYQINVNIDLKLSTNKETLDNLQEIINTDLFVVFQTSDDSLFITGFYEPLNVTEASILSTGVNMTDKGENHLSITGTDLNLPRKLDPDFIKLFYGAEKA